MPEDAGSCSPTLLDVTRQRAERYRDKVAFDYCHYSPGGEEHSRLTYRELDIKARAIASTLQRLGATGERVLVLCPSGLDFVAASSDVSTPEPSRYRSIRRCATG